MGTNIVVNDHDTRRSKEKGTYTVLLKSSAAAKAWTIKAVKWMLKLRGLTDFIDVKVFRLCDNCNKEFEAEISMDHQGKYYTMFQNCPFCKARNDIWVRAEVKFKDVNR